MDNEKKDSKRMQPQVQEIDLLELAKKVWTDRKLIAKVCLVGAVVGLVVGISTPKVYTSTILIAPESFSKGTSGSMGTLAAMAGINLGSGSSRDAIYPDLYPDIVGSTPFLVGLFDLPVHRMQDTTSMTLATYMKDHQKSPWWSAVMGAPFRLIGWTLSLIKGESEEENGERQVDVFRLTRDEAGVAGAINRCISVAVEKKTYVTTLQVSMQDPLIAATVADSVRARLQDYITEYRTEKARQSLQYVQKLYKEAQADYYKAQEEYARYADANQSLITLKSRAEVERLQNERNLAYGTYSQMAQQLQMAKAKVDEITPVYTIIQPATVPLVPTKPRKLMIIVGFVFLCGVGSVGWILFLKDLLRKKPQA